MSESKYDPYDPGNWRDGDDAVGNARADRDIAMLAGYADGSKSAEVANASRRVVEWLNARTIQASVVEQAPERCAGCYARCTNNPPDCYAAPTAEVERAPLRMETGELAEFRQTVEDFDENCETSTPYDVLMYWAEHDLLSCDHFTVTDKGRALLSQEVVQFATPQNLVAPVAPIAEQDKRDTEQAPVAQVDEGDEGLFVAILQGENGSALKRGDTLYAAAPPLKTWQDGVGLLWDVYDNRGQWFKRVVSPIGWDAHTVHQYMCSVGHYAPHLDVRLVSASNCADGEVKSDA